MLWSPCPLCIDPIALNRESYGNIILTVFSYDLVIHIRANALLILSPAFHIVGQHIPKIHFLSAIL